MQFSPYTSLRLQISQTPTEFQRLAQETVSDRCVWGLVCWPLDHRDTFNLTQYIVYIEFL